MDFRLSTSRAHRYQIGAVAAVVLLLATALFVATRHRSASERPDDRFAGLYVDNTAVLGDADGDGTLSATESEDLRVTDASVRRVRDQVAPRDGLNTLLVTPAGRRWWSLVTGISAQTSNWATSAPTDGVRWYAYTESRARDEATGINRPYDALHVVFASEDDAVAWVADGSINGGTSASNVAYRGRVVTLTPSWVDPYRESYPEVDDSVLADIDVRIAMWQVDFSEQIQMRSEEAVTPRAYREVFRNLGFATKGATWTATSPAPDAIWRGRLAGFSAKRVDITKALTAINTSYLQCRPTSPNECGSGQGIAEAINMVWLAAGTEGGGEPLLAPADAPEQTDVTIVTDAGWRGAVRGDMGFSSSPIDTLAMWVTDGQILSVHPVLAPDAEESS